MMMKTPAVFLLSLMGLVLSFTVQSCSKIASQSDHAGHSSLLSVTLDGLNKDVFKLEGVEFVLKCNEQDRQKYYELKGQKDDKSNDIKFDDKKVKLGDQCAMEIWAKQRENDEGAFTWLARKEGKPVVGLFYSSNVSTVQVTKDASSKAPTKFLQLRLFKTYSIGYKDGFRVSVVVQFQEESGARLPQNTDDAYLTASLSCQLRDGVIVKETSYQYLPLNSSQDKKFLFYLSSGKMQKSSCFKLDVAINNKLVFSGDISGMNFDQPQKGEEPEANPRLAFGPFSVVPIYLLQPLVTCQQRDSEDDKNCIEIKFLDENPVWFALVAAKHSSTGEEKNLVVMPYFSLSADLTNNQKSIFDLNINKNNPTDYVFYEDSVATKMIQATFDPAQILASIQDQKVADMSAWDLISFRSVWVRSFKKIAEKELNAKQEGFWFAHIEAKLGNDSREIIVSGSSDFLRTKANEKLAGDKFFTVDSFKEFKPNTYRVFSVASSGSSTAEACKISLSYYRNELPAFSVTELTDRSKMAQVAACEITQDLSHLKDYSIQPQYYYLDWYSLSF